MRFRLESRLGLSHLPSGTLPCDVHYPTTSESVGASFIWASLAGASLLLWVGYLEPRWQGPHKGGPRQFSSAG